VREDDHDEHENKQDERDNEAQGGMTDNLNQINHATTSTEKPEEEAKGSSAVEGVPVYDENASVEYADVNEDILSYEQAFVETEPSTPSALNAEPPLKSRSKRRIEAVEHGKEREDTVVEGQSVLKKRAKQT